jgi:hypothetical protein
MLLPCDHIRFSSPQPDPIIRELHHTQATWPDSLEMPPFERMFWPIQQCELLVVAQSNRQTLRLLEPRECLLGRSRCASTVAPICLLLEAMSQEPDVQDLEPPQPHID